MKVDNWDEIRTAYHVAQLGTVSGAAQALGVHHATVIRHIDALEARVGVKLFQRHPRGYTPTEAGEDLMKVATATDDQFTQLVRRIRGRGSEVTGELVVTTVAGITSLLTPILTRFQADHPELTVRYLTDTRLFRLEYGEAHVAIRAGKTPEEPDNVVQPFLTLRTHLCAAPSYIHKYGLPKDLADLANHRFIAHDSDGFRAPHHQWMAEHIPAKAIVYRATEMLALESAVVAGAGIGFVSAWNKASHPDLVDVIEPLDEWGGRLWLVTHVDLHRTAKVQAFLKFLKAEARA